MEDGSFAHGKRIKRWREGEEETKKEGRQAVSTCQLPLMQQPPCAETAIRKHEIEKHENPIEGSVDLLPFLLFNPGGRACLPHVVIVGIKQELVVNKSF